jgi:phytol kinase
VGALCFPVAVAFVFALTLGRPEVYVASIVVLALSDSLAAIVGRARGRHLYKVPGGSKSIEGSIAFLVSAILSVYLTLRLLSPAADADCAARAFCAAVLATALEAASGRGTDNLTVPLGVCLVLLGTSGAVTTACALATLAWCAASALGRGAHASRS